MRAGQRTLSSGQPVNGLLHGLDRVVDWVSQGVGGCLVAVEVILLFAGVVGRYMFDHPLVWTDEVAGILFLWLVSVGAVIALRRTEHMRMTVVLGRLGPRARRLAGCLAAILVVLVALCLIVPGLSYARQQAAVLTPVLQMPASWEVYGQLAALVLLLYVALRQLLSGANWIEIACVLIFSAVVWFALDRIENALDLGNADLPIYFVGVVGVCIFLGVPIAFSFATATFAYIHFTGTIPLSVVISQMDQGMSSIELLAVPMFIVLGLLLEMTGIARAMVNFLAALVGHRRGGLHYVLIAAMYLISGISGSKAADQAAVAPVLLPEMRRRGVPPGELAALLAASAAMSETIPPSLVLIIVGAVTGVSISALFTGGLLPAGLAAAGLAILVLFRTRTDRPEGAKANAREIGRLLMVALPALILPFIIRYAVLAGVTTATEVATVGVVYAVLIGLFVYRCFEWRRLFPILVETAALSGSILLIIGSASAMAWSLTQAGFAQTLTEMMTSLPGGRAGFLAVSVALFVVLGSVLEGLPAMVLFGPLLFPAAQQLGIHLVQYGIVAILAMGIGLFAPPFGVGFYQTCLIGKVSSDEAFGRIWPYLAVLVVALIIVAAVPWISTGFVA
ncbi:TRAP transporter large permease [Caballeronia concitans]|uniref:TrapT dctQ-M fusion permease, dicarboxylate transport n=1 Tax=Caballeronia concitans TaxID=1777133 RepID=A0A658QTP8_9BURK|nr:TRAP dicarboxylate transporter, DctM subunit [Burkholderia sp. MR1]SAL20850.1 TrapT dctQ-M fusion permease, dicarboxylate transport [Caballeronia concitans]